MNKTTYIITRSQIEKAFSMPEYIDAVESVFKQFGRGQVQAPPKVYLQFLKGDLRCMPAYIPSVNLAGVKNVSVHPRNERLPTVMATITLFDPETGFPIAIMDGTHITNMRTGAAGGVAVKYLARKDSKVAAFIGAGVQARTQLEALLVVRPGIEKVTAWDINEKNTVTFLQWAHFKFGIKGELSSTVQDTLRVADVVITTTPSLIPIVRLEWLRNGMHINAIGADAPGKRELDISILDVATVVVDDREQASISGEINVPLAKGLIDITYIYADIGEIVTGRKSVIPSLDTITVFDSTGLAIQDIFCAAQIYRKLMSESEFELERFCFFR